MTWQTLPTAVQDVATNHLTDKQLETWKCELAGHSVRRIAYLMDVTPRVIADRLTRTHQLLLRHGVRQDDFGRWHIEEAA